MPVHEERRRNPRLPRHERLFIEIISSTQDPSLTGQTIKCSTDDLSVSGLRIRLDHAVPAGCLLDLWVKVGAHPGTFLFTGEVKWSQEEGEGTFLIGVELRDRPRDDNKAWREMISKELL